MEKDSTSRTPQAAELSNRARLRESRERVNSDSDARKVLGDHRRLRRAGHAAVQTEDEPEVERDVQHGRNRQKRQRHDGISDGS